METYVYSFTSSMGCAVCLALGRRKGSVLRWPHCKFLMFHDENQGQRSEEAGVMSSAGGRAWDCADCLQLSLLLESSERFGQL